MERRKLFSKFGDLYSNSKQFKQGRQNAHLYESSDSFTLKQFTKQIKLLKITVDMIHSLNASVCWKQEYFI